MQARSISREIAILVLGQINYDHNLDLKNISLDNLLMLGLETLSNHWREQLDECALQIQAAEQKLLDSELSENDKNPNIQVRLHLTTC